MFALLKTVAVMLALCCTVDAAAMAPRSVPSPGGMCYFKCPIYYGQSAMYINHYTNQGKAISGCTYSPGVFCEYFDNTGALNDGSNGCPKQVTISKCTGTTQGNPDTNQYFKRNVVPRSMSKGEERLKARQYKAKRIQRV